MAGKHVGGSVSASGQPPARLRVSHYHNHRLDKAYAEGRAGIPHSHAAGSPAADAWDKGNDNLATASWQYETAVA